MSILTFSQSLAQELYTSAEQFPVEFEYAWQWLEYSRKDNAKRKFNKLGFIEGVDYVSAFLNREGCLTDKTSDESGKFPEVIQLTCECLKQWGMMAGTPKGKEIRAYFLECERIAKSKPPETPTTYLEALKALVAKEEARVILEIANAELTKANEQLSEVVDELFDYSSIIRIAKYNNISEKNFKWQTLKAVSIAKRLEIKRVPCPRFETKNLYHHDAWRYAYPSARLPETTTLVIKA